MKITKLWEFLASRFVPKELLKEPLQTEEKHPQDACSIENEERAREMVNIRANIIRLFLFSVVL